MIRASVQVQFLVPTVQTDDLVPTVQTDDQVLEENVLVTFAVPVSGASYFYLVADTEEDFQGRHPVHFEAAITPDVYAYILEKFFSDEVAYLGDSTINFVKKARLEPYEFSERRDVDLYKPIRDDLGATDDFRGEANLDDDQVSWVVKPRYDRSFTSDEDTIDFGKNVVDPTKTSEDVTRGMVRPYEDEYSPEDIKTFYLEKPFSDSVDYPTDDAVSHIQKNRTEEVAYTGDATTAYIKKVATDEPVTSEERTVSIIKTFFDAIGVTDDFFGGADPDDDQTMDFGKNVNVIDSDAGVLDQQTYGVNKPSAEIAGLVERAVYEFSKLSQEQVGSLDETVVTFLAEKTDFTVFHEIRTSAFTKEVADNLGATDDFLGETNVDDDQTSHVTRSVRDQLAVTEDVSTIGSAKNPNEAELLSENRDINLVRNTDEKYSVSDPFGYSAVKPLAESLGVADHLSISLAKFRRDGLLAPDDTAVYYFPVEGIPEQNDVGSVQEQSTINYWKSFADYGACVETVYALTYKRLSDTCGLYNEAQTLSLAKRPTEAVGVQNSGFVVMTDYCNSSYFAEPFVGVGREIT